MKRTGRRPPDSHVDQVRQEGAHARAEKAHEAQRPANRGTVVKRTGRRPPDSHVDQIVEEDATAAAPAALTSFDTEKLTLSGFNWRPIASRDTKLYTSVYHVTRKTLDSILAYQYREWMGMANSQENYRIYQTTDKMQAPARGAPLFESPRPLSPSDTLSTSMTVNQNKRWCMNPTAARSNIINNDCTKL
jgi:hypothetical protein